MTWQWGRSAFWNEVARVASATSSYWADITGGAGEGKCKCMCGAAGGGGEEEQEGEHEEGGAQAPPSYGGRPTVRLFGWWDRDRSRQRGPWVRCASFHALFACVCVCKGVYKDIIGVTWQWKGNLNHSSLFQS